MDNQLYFVFAVRNILYAIESAAVSETFNLPEVTPVEELPEHVVGVINLRDNIVRIVDLNLMFGRGLFDLKLTDGVLVVQDGARNIGLIVNEVVDVIDIKPEWIDHAQSHGNSLLLGMARVNEQIINVLDHEKILDAGCEDEGSHHGEAARENFYARYAGLSEAVREQFHQRAQELVHKLESDLSSEMLQVAVVNLGTEFFGIDIKHVHEFTKVRNLTPLPNCPSHVIGNMNLRGSILTVIDIRGSLGMPVSNFGAEAKIVVGENGGMSLGVMVDDIDEIVPLRPSDIVTLPASTPPELMRYAMGTVHYGQKAMTILNFDEILKSRELVVG